MSDSKNNLEQLAQLLQIEKEEDLKLYKLKMANTSIQARIKNGVCWYPVIIEKTGFSAGEKPIINISRPPNQTNNHLFSSGKLVALFSNDTGNEGTVNGVINHASKSTMMITLNSDELPYWLNKGKIGVQLLFDDSGYKEMFKSLKRLKKNSDKETQHLLDLFFDKTQPEFDESIEDATFDKLNASQQKAANKILKAKDVAIVHGPPGTGKTTTLIAAIIKTLQSEKQVLVCAPSNNAIDLLVEKLDKKNINVLRIGHPARVMESALRQTLEAQISEHHDYKDLKQLRKKSEEYFSLAKKYKHSFGYAEREQRKLLYDEAHQYKDAAEQLNFYIINNIINKADVIASTLVAANNYAIRELKFNTVFIDEAAQAMTPACLIPIQKARRIVFAGDHQQLPPTIKSFEAIKGGLASTLFESMVNKSPESSVMLNEQYRMNNTIMSFSNQYFYNNELKAHPSVAAHLLFDNDDAIEFIDTAGTGFNEEIDEESLSKYNSGEIDVLIAHLEAYVQNLNPSTQTSIGIIAPYSAQIQRMKEKVNLQEEHIDLSINTVDGFQGQERDIIYLSLTRSNEKSEIGFLADLRRINVAMTRAKKKLVIIGDSATLGAHTFYSQLIDHITTNGLYTSAYQYLS